jgi:hypothetical protein
LCAPLAEGYPGKVRAKPGCQLTIVLAWDDAVWLDKDRVIGGSNWSQVIEEEIDSAAVIKAKND